MDDGGSDVMTWDEISARENGTDGFFGDLRDEDVDDESEEDADADYIDYGRYDEDFGDY